MAEYIEREALQETINQANCPEEDWDYVNNARYALDLVRNFPAADVAPVVHGHWVGLEYDGYADGFPVYDLWECSECGNEERGEDVPETHPFCNWCGARMDGDD